MWNLVTKDLASAGNSGWLRTMPDGGPALLTERGYLLDAQYEDAIFTLPPVSENLGRVFWFKRIDPPGSMFVAEVEAGSSLDTIEGAASYPLASQWASVVLVAGYENTWLVQSEIL